MYFKYRRGCRAGLDGIGESCLVLVWSLQEACLDLDLEPDREAGSAVVRLRLLTAWWLLEWNGMFDSWWKEEMEKFDALVS